MGRSKTNEVCSESVNRVALFGPWAGEFGWEVATYQPWVRKQAKNYDKVYVCSFPDMKALYKDFAEFVPHSYPERDLFWTKNRGFDLSKVKYVVPKDVNTFVDPVYKYRVDGDFIKFGSKPNTRFTCLVHAVKHKHKNKLRKDYPEELWLEVVKQLPKNTACIGTKSDLYIEGTTDLRGISLSQLMNYMAGCQVVVGSSSGPMILAIFCLAPIVVWGPGKGLFEPLEERYKKTWNPFGSTVEYVIANNWQPDPMDILLAMSKIVA